MLCQECGKRPATLHFTKIVNGEKTEFHFCETCAREKGIDPRHVEWFFYTQFAVRSSGSGSFRQGPEPRRKTAQTLQCEECGMTYSQFSKLGRFGCSSCYKYFSDRLDPLFKRVHGEHPMWAKCRSVRVAGFRSNAKSMSLRRSFKFGSCRRSLKRLPRSGTKSVSWSEIWLRDKIVRFCTLVGGMRDV